MPERRFLSDLLQRLAGAGRLGRGRNGRDAPDLMALCTDLLGDRGELSGLVNALQVLDGFDAADATARLAFFGAVSARFGVDSAALERVIAAWKPGDDAAARKIHIAAEPKSQELIRRLNRVPGATAKLVAMRAELLSVLPNAPDLSGLDQDFQHLFSSWFNRGFLEIRRIDWSTSAAILEKVIAYEAVHEITGWDDLRQRVADPDRRLFAFFHPAMPADPLIFIEVALTKQIPGAIAPILNSQRDKVDPRAATTAVFYSISNCQKGLRGISFGNFLIKQVVAELQAELPGLKTFVTLSPVPGFSAWLAKATDDDVLTKDEINQLRDLPIGALPEAALAQKLAARYLMLAKRSEGTPYDPVAHFHLGNGAALHKVHANADLSDNGRKAAFGVMVNYLYDGDRIEENHQAYATERKIAASAEVKALASKTTK